MYYIVRIWAFGKAFNSKIFILPGGATGWKILVGEDLPLKEAANLKKNEH